MVSFVFKVSPKSHLQTVKLTDDQLNGICTAAYCVYGDSEVDQMFKFGTEGDGLDGRDTPGQVMADYEYVMATDQSHFDELPVW